MDSTVAVHTKGFGFSFQASRNSVMASFRSSTLPNEPANTLARQLSEPALYQVQPTRTGRHKMKSETRMFLQPGVDLLLLVGAIVVHHQVQGNWSGKFFV
jgi:hypothetical protein